MTNEIHEKKEAATLPTPAKPSKISEPPKENFINDFPGVKEIELPESGSLGKKPANEMNDRSEKNVENEEPSDSDFTQKLPSDDHTSDQY